MDTNKRLAEIKEQNDVNKFMIARSSYHLMEVIEKAKILAVSLENAQKITQMIDEVVAYLEKTSGGDES